MGVDMPRRGGTMAWMRMFPQLGRTLLFAAVLAAVSGCSAPLLPPPDAPRATAAQAVRSNADLLAAMRGCWERLKNPKLTDDQRLDIIREYNADLLYLLRRLRHELDAVDSMDQIAFLKEIEVAYDGQVSPHALARVYDDVVPAVDVHLEQLKERYDVRGLGVPMVGVVPAEKVANARNKFNIRTKGTVSTITAVMQFPEQGRPRLDMVLRQRHETARVGRLDYSLAADFSAPLEVYWRLTKLDDSRFLGLLRPQKLRDLTGLSSVEEYNPEKIPVILTHGLLSDAGTFDNLVNRLNSCPEIRRHFQFWYFNYPTGNAWVQTAEKYRESLEEVRNTLDPQHTNANWDRLVAVGHSMGGLITHYSQCTEPWKLLENSGSIRHEVMRGVGAQYIHRRFEDTEVEKFRKQYFFEPVQAGMVVYMATPHRGAPLASYRITRAIAKLVHLPENLVKEAVNLLTLQEDIFLLRPQELTDWFTSVNQLSPTSYSIRGLQGLQVRGVPTYSVIGDRGQGDSPRSSDGVVPYWSSHIPWGQEKIVPADHSVQDVKETADYMRQILLDYLHSQKPAARRAGK